MCVYLHICIIVHNPGTKNGILRFYDLFSHPLGILVRCCSLEEREDNVCFAFFTPNVPEAV